MALRVGELQEALREIASRGREIVDVPPFTAHFHSGDSAKWVNYAIPERGAKPQPRQIDALRKAFRSRGLLPRLEFIEEAAPAVAPALAAAGMIKELRTPLMACAPAELVEVRAEIEGLEVAPVTDESLRETSSVLRVAFGGEPLPADEKPYDIRTRGGGCVVARVGGEVVAAASWTPIAAGATEIVGVATAEPWRRRGLAGMLTAEAARDAQAAGAELFMLTPGDETALRVYERAGFRRVATMLHYSDEF